jgi:mono/diheme cytochrome c family protein
MTDAHKWILYRYYEYRNAAATRGRSGNLTAAYRRKMLKNQFELAMDKLLAIKAYLYAILTALLIVVGVIIYATISAPKPAVPVFICGNADDPEPSNLRYTSGKELFVINCASCHAKNMRNNLTGPALGPAVAGQRPVCLYSGQSGDA